MRSKAVLEIKTSSSDFRICNSPQNASLSCSHSVSLLFGLSVLILFPQISRRSKCCMLCSSITLTVKFSAFFLLIACPLSSPLFSSYLPLLLLPLANLSSHTESHALVKAAWFGFNTFLWHGRLGSHDHAVPWPLTREALTILLWALIGLSVVKPCNPAKRVHSSEKDSPTWGKQ